MSSSIRIHRAAALPPSLRLLHLAMLNRDQLWKDGTGVVRITVGGGERKLTICTSNSLPRASPNHFAESFPCRSLEALLISLIFNSRGFGFR